MATELTFDTIAAAGRAIVEAHKQKRGFEEGIRRLLSELYPDNAHFIYELLQNAEDAKASVVEFELRLGGLEVRHNGSRSFTLEDIDSIANIGDSTKKDDPTQIGKFGVGFKAVYSYTTRPEIRSGDYSFAIQDLFVPEHIEGRAAGSWTTFYFPFDRSDKSADTACAEIERRLTELDEKTLLFLNHISTITYELRDGTVGIIERRPVDSRIIAIKRSEGGDFVESHWLRLMGNASVDGPSASPLTVAAAFKVEAADGPRSKKAKNGEAQDLAPRRSIVPVDDGDVSIYFPAVKEFSGLRFHIHAPFASTVARDSVRDDPGNVRLVGDLATLIANALPGMCADGLIDDSFLATLPNEDDQIGHPYSLIRDGITEAFNELEITPVRGTAAGFAPARTLVASPSEFRNWLDPGELPNLFEFAGNETSATPRWIRDRDGRAGKFLAGLDTMEFGWEELIKALSSADCADDILADIDDDYDEDDKAAARAWFSWLAAKSDDDLLRLYQLIGFGSREHKSFRFYSSWLDDVPIVRLVRRNTVTHVRGSATFLPSGRSDTVQSRVPINLAYFEDDEDATRAANLKAFYRAVGTKRWDESARAERRLAAYSTQDRPIPEGDDLTQHLQDIRAFVRYAARDVNARRALSSAYLLMADQSEGGPRWVTARQTFVDLPFRDSGLSALYPRKKLFWKNGGGYAYDQEPYPLAGVYLDVDGIDDFLGSLGAKTGIEITKAPVARNAEFSYSWRANNRETAQGHRSDWGIERLNDIIGTGDHDLLRALWRTVVEAPATKAIAVYQANASVQRHQMVSQLARTLTSRPWVLNRDGDLKLPREVCIDELPDDWPAPQQSSLVYKLDFGADAVRRRQKREGVTDYLREEGLDEDALDLLREVKEQGLDLRAILREHAAMAQFPEGPSEDPVRRAGITALDAASAPEFSTSIRDRSVVDGQAQASAESRAYLRGQYTTASGDMHCQACRKQLPFKIKDGSWYFEAVRLVNARKQVHTANALALCPLCAALYKYARGTNNGAILDHLVGTIIDAGVGLVEIPVVLNGKRVKLAFTGKHAIDVKTALGVAGDGRRDD
ncbi:sacsin N-terminal ATP-binding-like domain-containing protein [Nocardioides sp. GCM10028917]|uniref:sacsin N-terminal ATP-binding-like domain-containing protein n=1 Tax=Nocardioides sp. GCM10028917 TaxID=3273408 RepID=UPI00361297EE